MTSSEIEKKRICDISFVIVNGMGIECPNEFNISESYKNVIDRNTGNNCLIEDNLIKNVSINKGIVDIEISLKENINNSLKFVYYVEL